MRFIMEEMNETLAKEIVRWRYAAPYHFYNNEITEEAITERLDGSYKAVFDEHGDIFGFLCTGAAAQIPIGNEYGVYKESSVDIGLGMNPKYVGMGYGYDFCTFILNDISETYGSMPIRLSVAAFNKRAIHLYEKLGFATKDVFATDTTSFVTMIKRD